MDIIFVTFKNYLLPLSILLQKFGIRIFYLRFEGSSGHKTKLWTDLLKDKNILPLPLESLPHISKTLEGYSDPQMNVFKISQKYASKEFISGFVKLFPDNKNISKKLGIIIHWSIARKIRAVTGPVNIWARENKDSNHILIDIRLSGLLTPGLLPNVKLIVIPVDIIEKVIIKIINVFHRLVQSLIRQPSQTKNPCEHQEKARSHEFHKSRIAFVADSDGPLPYSDNKKSELHRENILHLYYRFFPGSSEKIKWAQIWSPNKIFDTKTINCAFTVIRHGIFHVRSIKNILALFIIACFYVKFCSFVRELEKYPSLEVVFIKNDIYSPKALLLACEARGIKTVALQYRFDLSNNYLVGSTILTYYLCASRFVADIMQKSPLYCIEQYIPVGLYHSDKLIHAKVSSPPDVLKKPIARGFSIVTALGWTIPLNWYESYPEYRLGWIAHLHFLNDMYRLSRDIPDTFIILRYVNTDWMSLPIFAETVAKIMASENMTISTDYADKFANYDLCAHSDLVIANKHDRIANECLSAGIPVLFHNYSHNTKELIWNVYSSSSQVMCNNYSELLYRSRIVLNRAPDGLLAEEYEYLKNVVLGGLGDGKVRERTTEFIQKLLS